MNKLIYLWFAVKTVFCTCQPDHRTNDFKKVKSDYKIKKIGTLPAEINESSGLARGDSDSTFWSHNDSGGEAALYAFSYAGRLIAKKPIPGSKNVDWEDMSRDREGHFYIGDTGNNGAHRNAFDIYKLRNGDRQAGKITFHYQGQKPLTQKPEKPVFDCEAFFHHGKHLYLFSKNWDKTSYVKLYRLPDEPGNYEAELLDSIYINRQVTSADISPDGKTFALLTYGKVLLFDTGHGAINFGRPKGCFRFSGKQSEAIAFLNNTDMLITNEQRDLYRVTFH